MSLLPRRCNGALINWVIIIGQDENEMQLNQLKNFFSSPLRASLMKKFKAPLNALISDFFMNQSCTEAKS